MEQFRLIQDGQKVAVAEGPALRAEAEIYRYAADYAQDGPVHIEQKINGRWKFIAGWAGPAA